MAGRETDLTLEEMVALAAIDRVTFLESIEQSLDPELKPGQIVVMDYVAIHKVTGVREAIEACGVDLWYQPPY